MTDKEKTLILDLDGTVTRHSTWAELNSAFGITQEQDEELFKQYRQGSLPYQEWTRKLIEAYHSNNSPLRKEQLVQLAENIELHVDAKDFVKNSQNKNYKVILVSGSVDILVEHIAKKLNTDGWLATTKAVFEEDVLKDLISMGDEGPAKVKLVEEAGISLSKDTISVGDGGNEKELFKLTKGILVGGDQELLPLAWKKVNNLTEAVDLLP